MDASATSICENEECAKDFISFRANQRFCTSFCAKAVYERRRSQEVKSTRNRTASQPQFKRFVSVVMLQGAIGEDFVGLANDIIDGKRLCLPV